MQGSRPERKKGKQAGEVAEQTKRDMIDTALRVFARHGFEGVSLRDIALETGTTHGLIRHYFGTKEGLWQAAVDQAVRRYATALAPHTAEVMRDSSDALALAQDVVRNFLLVSARYPDILRIILHEGVSGGPRLNYALAQFAPLGDAMEPLLARLHQHGYVRQFNNRSFFLFLITGGAAPFALSAFTQAMIGETAGAETQLQEHIDRFNDTLFGTASAPPA
jgi:TetR/AcrR family transcriptional regulator